MSRTIYIHISMYNVYIYVIYLSITSLKKTRASSKTTYLHQTPGGPGKPPDRRKSVHPGSRFESIEMVKRLREIYIYTFTHTMIPAHVMYIFNYIYITCTFKCEISIASFLSINLKRKCNGNTSPLNTLGPQNHEK